MPAIARRMAGEKSERLKYFLTIGWVAVSTVRAYEIPKEQSHGRSSNKGSEPAKARA